MSRNSSVASSPISLSPRIIDSSSMVPPSTLDVQLLNMLNRRVTYAHIDYFLDTLTTLVARATIAQPYKAAFDLKGTRLASIITTFIQRAKIDVRIILTATVYLCRIPIGKVEMDSWVCERLAIAALMTAQKCTHDAAHKGPTWVWAAQFFTATDVYRMEREFLKLLDYSTNPSTAELLAHYTALMQRVDACDASWEQLTHQGSVFSRPERAPACDVVRPSPPIFLAPRERVPTPPPFCDLTADELPDLAYPGSPMSDFESDGYSSDESASVITPLDPGAHASGSAAAAHPRACPDHATTTTTAAPATYSSHPAHEHEPNCGRAESPACAYDVLKKDPAMDARIRFYAADCGAVLGDPESPRFVPFSPSLPVYAQKQPQPQYQHQAYYSDEQQQQQQQREPASGPRRALADRRQTQAGPRMHPWRRMQSWKSSMSADRTWGNFGMFKN